MPVQAGTQLSEEERVEFDYWGAEQINRTDDAEKLKKAADYYRQQGFLMTADAVEKRLVQLAKSEPSRRSAVHGDTAEARASIESFQDELKQFSRLASQNTRVPDMQQELHPPVRGGLDPKCTIKNSGKKHKGTAAMRQSLDLLDEKDQQLLGAHGLKIPSQGTAPKAAAPTAGIHDALAAAAALGLTPDVFASAAAELSPGQQQQQDKKSQPLVQEVKLKGAKRTQHLVEQNKQLPKQDRLAMSLQKRCSGNEYFRAGAFGDAVEEYTLALALDPGNATCYTNRAATYLKLKEWQSAVADCDMALALLKGYSDPDQKLKSKTLLRRAEAHAGLASHDQALQDFEAVLSLVPEEPRAQQGAKAARAALGIKSGMRRMAVIETDDNTSSNLDSDNDDDDAEQQQQQQQLKQMAPALREQLQPESTQHSTQQKLFTASSSDQTEDARTSAAGHASAVEPADQASASSNMGSSHVLPERQAADAEIPTVPATDADAAQGSSGIHGRSMYHFTACPAAGAVAKNAADAIAAGDVETADAHLMARLQEAMDQFAQAAEHGGLDNSIMQPGAYDHAHDTGSDKGSSISGTSSDTGSSSSSCTEALGAAVGCKFDDDQPELQGLPEPGIDVPPTFDEQLTQLKDAGNAMFKAKAYSEAVALYSKALQHAPDAALVYVNRAMALLELNRHEKAHEDSSIAISLQPDNFKAFHKRYKAKQGLKDYLGAIADLRACIQHAPKINNKLQSDLRGELQQLQEEAEGALANEVLKAEAAQGASVHAYGTCVIEEVTDSPKELQQKLSQELQRKEQSYAKQAARCAQTAAQKRADYELMRQQMLEQQQHKLQALQEHQQRKQQHRQVLAEQSAQLSAERAARKAEHDARRKAKADAAAAVQPGTSSSSSSAAIDILRSSSGRKAEPAMLAGAADPPTPPASPFDSKLIHVMTAARAGRVAARSAAGTVSTPAQCATPACSTPAATPLTNATPAVTPAGSFIPASTFLQQQRRTAPTPEQVECQVAAEVEALKQKGNALLQQGKLDAAETAYQEALQLDGDNVKVLLNLAWLRLKQEDGAGAVRCCEEVLAQQDLPEQARLKALVRLGLGLELLGNCAAALTQLSGVAEQNSAAGRAIDEQLARDIARIAVKVQQQHHLQQDDLQRDAESTAPPLTLAAPSATTAQQQQQSADQQQQQPSAVGAVLAFTGMRASIPIVSDSDENESGDEAGQAGEGTWKSHSSSNSGATTSRPGSEVFTAPFLRDSSQASGAAATSQQQHHTSASASAAAPSSARLAKVAVVFDSDTESSEGEQLEPAARQRQEEETNVPAPRSTKAAAATPEPPPSEACDEPAIVRNAQTMAGPAQQQQGVVEEGGCSSLPQRCRSTGEAAAEELDVAAFAAISSMNKLLYTTAQSPVQRLERAGSSNSTGSQASTSRDQDSSGSSGSSSSGEVLHWDPFAPEPDVLQQADKLSTHDLESLGLWDKFIKKQQQQQGEKQQQQQQQQQCSPQQEQERLRQQAAEASIMHKLDVAELALLPPMFRARSQKSEKGVSSIKELEAWQQQMATACTEAANKAAAQRASGEAALQKGSTQMALKHYNAAVSASPKDPLSYAGRAVVWMKLKRWQHAEDDLLTVLVLAKHDSGIVAKYSGGRANAALIRKVRHRCALVWKEMGKVKEAISEVKLLLAECPSDSSLQRLMDECKQLYAKQVHQALQAAEQQRRQQQEEEEASSSSSAAAAAAAEVPVPADAAAAASPEPVSHVQRHTIVIEETDGSESEDSEAGQEVHIPDTTERGARQGDGMDVQAAHMAVGSHGRPVVSSSAVTPAQGKQAAAAAARIHVPAAATEAEAAHQPAAAERVLQHLARKQFAAPTRVADFVNAAKTLTAVHQSAGGPGPSAGSQQTLGQYVRVFEPSKYRDVIKNELNQEILRYLVSGYQALVEQEPQFVAEALVALGKVQRFGLVMAMACANKGIKSGLQGLVQQLEKAGHDVTELKGSFKLALK